MKIDVVVVTKNSMIPCLPECIKAIYDNVPLNRLIVVDGGSTDGTIEFLKEFPNVVIIDDSKGNRGTARQKGIEKAGTEWFAFVDSDVVLCDKWFEKISKQITGRVGAIEGRVQRLYEKRPPKIKPSGRGLTHCTLIRRSAVQKINIPPEMHVMEDQFIRRYIEKQGYLWLKAFYPISKHFQAELFGEDLNSTRMSGKMIGKYDLLPLWKDIAVLAKFPFKNNRERKALLYKLIGRLEGMLCKH